MLETRRVFVDPELDVGAAVPENVSVGIAAVVGEAGQDDDALSDQPHRHVLGKMNLGPMEGEESKVETRADLGKKLEGLKQLERLLQ